MDRRDHRAMGDESSGKNPFQRSEASRDYEVGYGRPPKQTRFREGVSGNPKGRPKGSKNKGPKMSNNAFDEMVMREANRQMRVREGEEVLTLSRIEAVVRATFNKALKGDMRAAIAIQTRVAEIEARKADEQRQIFEALVIYKRDAERELRRRREKGDTNEAGILPHPDDIIIDPRTGSASIQGPISEDEAPRWDKACEEIETQRSILERINNLENERELSDVEKELRSKILIDLEEMEPMFSNYQKRKARREAREAQ